MMPLGCTSLTVEDHRKALLEVSFLLEIFADTVHDLMGGATRPVGRIAGRGAARKLPVYLPDATLEAALSALAAQCARGFEITSQVASSAAELRFGRCAIREACRARGLEPGGRLCQLFHYYLDGVTNELCRRPVRSTLKVVGEACAATLEVR